MNTNKKIDKPIAYALVVGFLLFEAVFIIAGLVLVFTGKPFLMLVGGLMLISSPIILAATIKNTKKNKKE